MSKALEAINFGNATVNSANAINAADPNHPDKILSSKDWVNAAGSSYGYLGNLFQIGGKTLPYANTVAVGSATYSLGYDVINFNTMNTSDLLGLSSALLGAAATGIVAAGTAPVWVPVALATAALAAGAAGTIYQEQINLGDLGKNLSEDFNKFEKEYDRVLNDAANKFNTTKEELSKAIDEIVDKALDLGEKFGEWVKDTWEESVGTFKEWVWQIPDNHRQDDWGSPDNRNWCTPEDWERWLKANRDGKYHIYVVDPLVLDLDGDGIETVSHNGYKGALFDHDGDGIRTASGWVGKDDGLLVIDRNGDGVINDGRELFGDSYILKDGSKAAHGYAALAEYDENGDGKVDAQDADFAKLRVWRDLNQDGISQQDELFTLEEAGVQSLNVAYQDTNQNLGNGNRLAQEGSYTDKEGKERKMGDLLFGNNTLYSRYSASVKLTDEQRAAANLQGTGRLRDLREAAALSPVFQSYYRIGFKQKQKCLWKEIQCQFKRSSETVFQTTF